MPPNRHLSQERLIPIIDVSSCLQVGTKALCRFRMDRQDILLATLPRRASGITTTRGEQTGDLEADDS